jgi:hypothetical protein
MTEQPDSIPEVPIQGDTASEGVATHPEPGQFEAAQASYAEQGETDEPAEEVVEAGDLKGEALDQALADRGLAKTGTADEKRERVAEYDANQ